MASLISFLFVIGVCVIVHETGHFITARMLDVQVHEFSFGMGPLLAQRAGRNTTWSLRALPVGGFVRLAGMGEERDGEEVAEGKGFYDKAPWKRFLVLFNGSLFNILLAMLLTATFLYGHGVLDLTTTTVGEIIEGYPAQSAGVLPGDRLLAIAGQDVSSWREMSEGIRAAAAKGPVDIALERDGERIAMSVTIPPDEQGITLLGIRPALKRYPAGEALTSALSYTVEMTVEMLRSIIRFIIGAEKVDVAGPVGIASMAGEAARKGLWTFVTFLALINLNLGLLNLFPFPALDGGRLVFTVGEMILRRRVPEKLENFIHMSGFVLLIMLIIYVTWQDIVNVFGWR
ncbi:MAG: RIP metalloprotease RseP [Synergistota bacterium]|nr:RIP metalloprotease RseP [Synergistota bacterium]